MHHANDNHPRSPEEHRRILAQQRANQAGTEVRARNREWPTFGRLKRTDAWREIQALERYGADEGLDVAGGFHAANECVRDADGRIVDVLRVW